VARRTKIVATIGPASDSPEVLRDLIAGGMNVARLGFAHGTVAEQLDRFARIREVAADAGRHVGVLADLPGPKIRAGTFPDEGVYFREGDELRLVPGDGPSSFDVVHVDYPTLSDDLDVGDEVALGDGAARIVITDRRHDGLVAEVLHGARVQGRPGVHLPVTRTRAEVPTPEDLDLLEIITDAGFDFVAISFVRSAADIERARKATDGSGLMLVAKIETQGALGDLDGIIETSDAVMVARGDLGVECDLAEIPHLQKRIIRQCVAFGRPVITATQMLESMIHAPSPTRAEATDVANAVFDGTDALMLSGETAIGHDPALTVRTMAHIAQRAEDEADYVAWGGRLGKLQRQAELDAELSLTAAMTHAAWRAAADAGAQAIICCTRSGTTARAVARFRPLPHLLGLTTSERTARQLSLTWGARSVLMDDAGSPDAMAAAAIAAACAHGHVNTGDVVAVLTGVPGGTGIDSLRIVRVGASRSAG